MRASSRYSRRHTMMSIWFPVGIVTGIGSLPHEETHDAVAFTHKHFPRLPAAPQLPRRSPLEGMIAQAAWGVPGVLVLEDGSLLVDEGAVDPTLPLVDGGIGGPPYDALRLFLDGLEGHDGHFKTQLTGPVTLGLALHALGVSVDRAFRMAEAVVTARVSALLAAVSQMAPQATPVLFLDEPGLCAALHPGFPLPVGQALDMVSSTMASAQRQAIVGLHCCGQADWQAVLQAGPQILSLPLGAGMTDHAGSLDGFLEAGGWVAWGAVPTDGPFTTSVNLLWRRLLAEWGQLVATGCDPVLLRERAIITPACGLVGLDVHQAEVAASLVGELGGRLAAIDGSALNLGA